MYFSYYFKIKALPASGSSSTKGVDAVAKSRKIAENFFKLKYPGLDITELALKKACTLELKYKCFDNTDVISKVKDLESAEV